MSHPMNGRRKQAARNDGLILDAAREVFLADPSAPISAVATRAGVGMSALYNRYASKEALLYALTLAALTDFATTVETALDRLEGQSPTRARAKAVYDQCLRRIVEGRSQALAQRLAGTFTPTDDLAALARRAGTAYNRLHELAQTSGALRADVSAADVTLVLEAVMTIDVPNEQLRQRYLALLAQSLTATSRAGLPGEPATDADLAARWRA